VIIQKEQQIPVFLLLLDITVCISEYCGANKSQDQLENFASNGANMQLKVAKKYFML